jgi:hypothetical protein
VAYRRQVNQIIYPNNNYMKKQEENKFTMYLAVRDALAEYESLWNGIPGFVNAQGQFMNVIAGLEDAEQRRLKVTTGVTLDKGAFREVLTVVADEIMGKVRAYANSVSNHTLGERVGMSRSELQGLRDTSLVEYCQSVHGEITAVASAVVAFGVAGSDLVLFQDAIDDFSASVSAPRLALGERVDAGIELVELFETGDGILKGQLDLLMKGMRRASSHFYNRYKSARKIVDV